MNHRPHLRLVAALLAGLTFCFGTNQALAQLGVTAIWEGDVDDNWDTGGNWSTGFTPDVFNFEVAAVNTGPTAIVNSDKTGFGPGGLTIGANAGETGGVEVQTGGNLPVTFSAGDTLTTGVLSVGSGSGVGTFTVSGSGVASAESITSGGAAGSGIFLSDTASLTSNTSSALNSALHITGPSVNFTTNSLTLGGNHNLNAILTSGAASTINVTGGATVGGNLNLDLAGAPAPSAGTTYDLIRAGSVSGSFGSISLDGISLNSGQQFVSANVADGANTLVQAQLIDVLVLQIDRDANTMAITNPTGGSISFDGYQVNSGVGSVNPGGFNGLAGQAIGDWEEANVGPNQLAELNPLGSSAATSDFALGNAYQANLDNFAVDPDDHTFTYRTEGGQVIDGQVEYLGTKVTNNFVLRIDPTTGAGQLFNDSATSLTIDGYTIKSESGSLDEAGFDGLGGGWVDSNSRPEQLTELHPDGSQTVAPGATVALGNIFDTTGSQDATFQFLFADTGGGGGTDDADFDGSGTVDGADLMTLQRSFGVDAGGDANQDAVTDGADQAIWNAQFGGAPGGGGGPGGDPNVIQNGIVQYQSLGAAAAVPEPSSVVLVCCSALALLALRRRQA